MPLKNASSLIYINKNQKQESTIISGDPPSINALIFFLSALRWSGSG